MDATLRSAAPYQKSRRKRAEEEGRKLRKVYVEKSDMRRCSSACMSVPATVAHKSYACGGMCQMAEEECLRTADTYRIKSSYTHFEVMQE